MKLLDLLNGVNYEVLSGSQDMEINHIQYDSRKIKDGDLFVLQDLKLMDMIMPSKLLKLVQKLLSVKKI